MISCHLADTSCGGQCLPDVAYCERQQTGSYSCKCKAGYQGDGITTCDGM